MEYYVIIDGRKCGPFSHEELRSKFVTPNMPVWREGMADWAPASSLAELSDVLQPAPQQANDNGGYDELITLSPRDIQYLPDSVWFLMLSDVLSWFHLRPHQLHKCQRDDYSLHYGAVRNGYEQGCHSA